MDSRRSPRDGALGNYSGGPLRHPPGAFSYSTLSDASQSERKVTYADSSIHFLSISSDEQCSTCAREESARGDSGSWFLQGAANVGAPTRAKIPPAFSGTGSQPPTLPYLRDFQRERSHLPSGPSVAATGTLMWASSPGPGTGMMPSLSTSPDMDRTKRTDPPSRPASRSPSM